MILKIITLQNDDLINRFLKGAAKIHSQKMWFQELSALVSNNGVLFN